MKSLKFFGLIIIAGILFTSCANVAHIEKDEAVNFNSFKTFAWVQTSADKNDSANHVTDLTSQRIRSAVNSELTKAGWRETRQKPDVLLSYDVLVEKTLKHDNDPVYSRSFNRYYFNPYTRRWGTIYYPSQFLGYESNQYQVREGTITITMVDAKTEKTVWQGWTTEEVNSKNLTSKEIQNSIRSIFRKFDVAQK
jgi:hypothetical protein